MAWRRPWNFRRYAKAVPTALITAMLASILAMLPANPNASADTTIVGVAPTPDGNGYWTVSATGTVTTSGDAVMYGDMSGKHLNKPVVGMAASPTGNGYWLVASDGGIFSFGDALFHGSAGSLKLNKPVVGMAASPTGNGYWLVASDGGVFSYGDALFHGSAGSLKLNKPVVGMAASPTGNGYWLVASDGGIFSYGDALFHGSAGSLKLNAPVVGMAATTTGNGYWLVATDGGVFSYGDAQFYGRPDGRYALGIVRTASGYTVLLSTGAPATYSSGGSSTSIPGTNSLICDQPSQLTSPWTYNALPSGEQLYTVAQYEALSGYGTTLPPLPSYISDQGAGASAAVIYAPGSTVNHPAYDFPATPLIHFFEGGAYGFLAYDTVNGDEFIGGSAPGFDEPQFDDAGGAGGINGQNGSYDFSGGDSTLAATASAGATTITTKAAIPGYLQYVTFADGSTYDISTNSGTSITLASALSSTEPSGSAVWASRMRPVASVSASAAQGATSISFTSSSIPFMTNAHLRIGSNPYTLASVSGTQSGYTISITGGANTAIAANTPVYYDGLAGDVTVSYLDINNDQHNTTGTIYTGTGWTISHNNIHDGYSTPGMGVALYGGDEGTIEYNCLSRMGDYGMNIFGTNNKFQYNEVYKSNYEPDPGCGCSGGGKWWGTLNADIVNNAFIDDSPGGGVAIWLDNGNTGTLISGNYFSKSSYSAVHSETGFNLDITNNLFEDGGWGDGTGAGDNNDGAININSSGGVDVPNSRYNNEIIISNNQFINNWMGINIWQSGARSCENSGEGWPYDANYCSGGYPTTAGAAASGQYYFSHTGNSNFGAATSVAQDVSAGSSTVEVQGALALNDQVGFSDPASTTTSDTTNVTGFAGSGIITVSSTTGFPTAGQLRVGTSAAWGDGGGSYTGAILSYSGKTATTFTGVNFVRGSGTLAGPVQQVQPYTVTSQTCYASDCVVTVSPSIANAVSAGTDVANTGTCQLFATSAATPSSPLAPNGTSYWQGCQWETRNVSITGNTFKFDPAAIASGTPVVGSGTSTVCSAAHTNSCGTNFMAYQPAGEAPFGSSLPANAMMSASSITGCAAWDAGCTSSPLKNLNALASPPAGAPAGTGMTPYNIVWANNAYTGPWQWNTYIYGTCSTITDPATSNSSPGGACAADFTDWQGDWQQDAGSTYTP